MILRKLLTLLVLLLSSSAWAGSSGRPEALVAGNTELVFVAFYDGLGNSPHLCMPADNCGGSALPGVSDAVGSIYRRLGIIQAPNHVSVEAWTATLAGDCVTDCAVMVRCSGTGSAPAVQFLQYSGVAAVNLTNITRGSGANATSARLAIASSSAKSLIVGAFAEHTTNALADALPWNPTLRPSGCTPRGHPTSDSHGMVELAACNSVPALPAATSVGMTFPRAAWSGIALELCTTNPCEVRKTARRR